MFNFAQKQLFFFLLIQCDYIFKNFTTFNFKHHHKALAFTQLQKLLSCPVFGAWVLVKFSMCTNKFSRLTYTVFPKTIQYCCFYGAQPIAKVLNTV